jgi:hypothetical protein
MWTGKIIQIHKLDIFFRENDGKASESLYKGGTIKGLSFEPHATRILKGKSTETALHDFIYKNLPWTSFELMDDVSSDHGVCSTIHRWIR